MSAQALPPPEVPDSLFYKVRYTPLRDLLRGKLTARLDLARIIDHAGLPPELSEIVRTTIKRTRLRWGEKADVARELVAHFTDGITGGSEPRSLAESFGDTRLAARLIRRARIRQRGIIFQTIRAAYRFIFAIIVLVIAAHLLLLVRLHLGTVRVSRNYAAELNAAALAAPEDDRAWPYYREAFLQTKPLPDGLKNLPSSLDRARRPELLEYLRANEAALQSLRLAVKRPTMGSLLTDLVDPEIEKRLAQPSLSMWLQPSALWTPSTRPATNPPVCSLSLPQYEVVRRFAGLLSADASVATEENDAARLTGDLDALFRLAKHASQLPFLAGSLTWISIYNKALSVIESTLYRKPEMLTDKQWTDLSHTAWAFLEDRPQMNLESEELFFADLLQRTYTDDGLGSGHFRPDDETLRLWILGGTARQTQRFLIQPLLSAVMANRADMLNKHRELMEKLRHELATPLWLKRDSEYESDLEQLRKGSYLDETRYLLATIVMPSANPLNRIVERSIQSRDAVCVAIALELYHRHHGAYPAALNALVPRYLPSVPPDRFDGRPIKYKQLDGKPLLYSIGVDRVDDGGVLPKGENRSGANNRAMDWYPSGEMEKLTDAERENYRGDWILWPPVED